MVVNVMFLVRRRITGAVVTSLLRRYLPELFSPVVLHSFLSPPTVSPSARVLRCAEDNGLPFTAADITTFATPLQRTLLALNGRSLLYEFKRAARWLTELRCGVCDVALRRRRDHCLPYAAFAVLPFYPPRGACRNACCSAYRGLVCRAFLRKDTKQHWVLRDMHCSAVRRKEGLVVLRVIP
jgi:hypothetical protein